MFCKRDVDLDWIWITYCNFEVLTGILTQISGLHPFHIKLAYSVELILEYQPYATL